MEKPITILQLIDINDHCLDIIFEHLELMDWFNLAKSHERFIPVIRSLFSRRHRGKKVILHSGTKFMTTSNEITVPKYMINSFIEYFGQKIQNLQIKYLAAKTEKLITKHCADSVIVLTLCSSINFDQINKPFEMVQSLVLDGCVLGKNSSQLNIWFPNIVSLRLRKIQSIHSASLETHFPNINHLTILDQTMEIPLNTVVNMLRLNPQLNSLSLVMKCNYNVKFLRAISEYLPHLEKFILNVPNDRFASFDDQKINFETVTKFTLSEFYYNGDFIVNMPFVFHQLRELIIGGCTELNGQITNFIKQNIDLNKLTLYFQNSSLTYDELVSTLKFLPKLTALTLVVDSYTPEQLFQFFAEYYSSNINLLRFAFLETKNYRKFSSETSKSDINTIWNVRKYPSIIWRWKIIVLEFSRR